MTPPIMSAREINVGDPVPFYAGNKVYHGRCLAVIGGEILVYHRRVRENYYIGTWQRGSGLKIVKRYTPSSLPKRWREAKGDQPCA